MVPDDHTMNNRPVHQITVTHGWQETGRVELVGDEYETSILECLDCGANTHLLDLDAHKGPKNSEVSSGRILAKVKEPFGALMDSIEKYKALIISGTEYNEFNDLIDDINRRFNIDARKLPFGKLEVWINTGNRKLRRKALLVFEQGPVCNRCDCVFYPSDLTIDHLDGNRDNSSLKNLQLLCKKCHRAKNREGNLPTERDVSPFLYDGERCLHQITCVELNQLERVPHNKP